MQTTLSLTEKRRQLLGRQNDGALRPSKLQRLTQSDSSSIPKSSQTLHPTLETPTSEPSDEPLVVDHRPSRRRRGPREVVYVPSPLARLQTADVSNSFWQGVLICYWGFVKPIPSPDVPTSKICTDYDLLPVNWLARMQEQSYTKGASIIVGGDESVFEKIIAMKGNRGNGGGGGGVFPPAVVHVCRPFNGHLSLQRAWQRWMARERKPAVPGGCPLLRTLTSPKIVSAETPYPAPSELHRVATPLWLQSCAEDNHHYPETGFTFFQPPLGKSYTPSLFRVKNSTRRLGVLLLGAHGSSKPGTRNAEDFSLWHNSIEYYLGGAIFPSKRLHHATNLSRFDDDPAEMRTYAKAQADSITFQPFSNSQGITSDLRVHDREADLPDIVVCLHNARDVVNFATQIGSTNLSRIQFNVKTTTAIMMLLEANIPFLSFRYLNECYKQTCVLETSNHRLNDLIRKAVNALVDNFQPVVPQPISVSNPGSAANSRASSRNPSTRPSLSGANGRDFWQLHSESLFDSIVSPEAVLEPRTPAVPQMVWSQAFNSESAAHTETGICVTRGVSWAPDLPALRLAISPMTLAEFPHFQDAAFQMLPVEKSAFIISPFAHEVWHLAAALEASIFAHVRELLSLPPREHLSDLLWQSLLSESKRPWAFQPLEVGTLSGDVSACRILAPRSPRFHAADVCLLILQRERESLRSLMTLLRDNYAHHFETLTESLHSSALTCIGDALAKTVRLHFTTLLQAARPLQPDALFAIARLGSHLLRRETALSSVNHMNIRGCIDVEVLKKQEDFANVAKLLYAPQGPLADATTNDHKEAIIKMTAKYICEHSLQMLEAARENCPVNLQLRINALRDIVRAVETEDAEMDGKCETKSLDVYVEPSQTALPPIEFEMSYGRKASRQSLFNGNTDKMRALERESEKITKRVISKLRAKWSFVDAVQEVPPSGVPTEVLIASLEDHI